MLFIILKRTCNDLATSSNVLADIGDGGSDTKLKLFGLIIAGHNNRRNKNPLKIISYFDKLS